MDGLVSEPFFLLENLERARTGRKTSGTVRYAGSVKQPETERNPDVLHAFYSNGPRRTAMRDAVKPAVPKAGWPMSRYGKP